MTLCRGSEVALQTTRTAHGLGENGRGSVALVMTSRSSQAYGRALCGWGRKKTIEAGGSEGGGYGDAVVQEVRCAGESAPAPELVVRTSLLEKEAAAQVADGCGEKRRETTSEP